METEEKNLLTLLIAVAIQSSSKIRLRMQRLFFQLLHLRNDLFITSLLLEMLFPERECLSDERREYSFQGNHSFNSDYWRDTFRMDRDTFAYICELCAPFMTPKDTRLREPIPLPKRVAVALNWLATGCSQKSIGERFGISKAIVQRICKTFIDGIFKLHPEFIQFPVTDVECNNVFDSFSGKTKLFGILGAIGRTHVPIQKPRGNANAVDYLSETQSYSVISQGVCDGNLKFLAVDSGFPGSFKSHHIFKHTWICDSAEKKEILQSPLNKIRERSIKPYLIGDSTYPIRTWLLIPYSHDDVNNRRFNSQLSKARGCIGRAFGLLKGRWRILLNKMEFSPQCASRIFIVCCVLHNILQCRGEREECTTEDELCHENGYQEDISDDGNAETLRNILRDFICEQC